MLSAALCLALGWAIPPPTAAANEPCPACLFAQAATRPLSPQLDPPRLQARFTRVPDVRGLSRAEAERILRAASLVLAEGGRRPGPDRADIVLEQSPAPNSTVTQGSSVTVILSAEPAGVSTPNLRGRPRTEAEAVLRRLGLQMAVGGQRESGDPADTVLEQKPEPGTRLPRGGTVTVILSVARAEPSPIVAVPDIQGRPRAEAERILQRSRLQMAVGGRQESDRPADTVLDQKPEPGTRTRPGGTVTVILSVPRTEPSPSVFVPDVRRRSAAEAERTLKDAGLPMAVGDRRPSEESPDTVLEQRPAPGTQVRRGTTVTVILSAPPATVRVPNVVGMDRSRAERTLRDAALVLAEGGRRPSGDPPETVLAQDPRPGDQATRGTAVSVILSAPREEPSPVSVPDVRGRPAAEAEAVLRGADLAMVEGERRPSQERPGTVLEQSPAPGTQVRRGARVTVVLSAPPETVNVPDVRGRSRAEAEQLLRGAGLVYLVGDRRPSPGRPDIVLDQEPQPGAQATRGTAVKVVLSAATPAPPAPVAVPDLRGRSEAEAARRLRAVGLALSVGGRQESQEPAGVVLQQEPAPGSQVSRGATVTVTLSVPVSLVPVPDVLGRPRAEAEQLLGAAALRMVEGDRRPRPGPPGVVLEQDPRPAAQVARGAEVRVILSAPEGFSVQWPVAAAAGAAALAGAGAVRWLKSRRTPRGKVPRLRIAVTPDPGTQALDVSAEDVRLPTLRLQGRTDPGRQELIVHDEVSSEEGQP